MMKHKTSIYWAIRALLPEYKFDFTIDDKFAYSYGSIICHDNFENVHKKKLKDYIEENQKHYSKLPVWC